MNKCTASQSTPWNKHCQVSTTAREEGSPGKLAISSSNLAIHLRRWPSQGVKYENLYTVNEWPQVKCFHACTVLSNVSMLVLCCQMAPCLYCTVNCSLTPLAGASQNRLQATGPPSSERPCVRGSAILLTPPERASTCMCKCYLY